MNFGLHSARVITPAGMEEATVMIENGKITKIDQGPLTKGGTVVEDLGDLVIMPGLIDSHVHINEPGRTEWEGFNTATRAAAAGGITTLVDMPLNSTPVTTNVVSFNAKLKAALGSIHVNCGFYGGLVPESYSDLEGLVNAGVLGIKAFLTHSGIDDFPNVSVHDLERALPLLKKSNSTLLVHAELDVPHDDLALLEKNPTSYQAYLRSRPRSWEDHAIKILIDLSEKYNARIHIVHLSSSNSIRPLKTAIGKGIPVSVETCPHYLVFNAENIAERQTQFKCAPPIRESENNDKLWEAIRDGLISFIVTDHSPALPSLKELASGDFRKAWGGIAGLQFSLPAFWMEAERRRFSLPDVARLLSGNVAKFLQLDARKGTLAPGYDADLLIWNPEKYFMVRPECIEHKHKVTPYAGLNLKGVVERTYVNGNLVFNGGQFLAMNKGEVILKQ
jgi:allantoinase